MNLPNKKEELYSIYYLKEELIKLCKENNLPANGSKENLLKYLSYFFENNPELSREDCIKCWKHKKKQIGSHKYEKKDLKILLDGKVKIQ